MRADRSSSEGVKARTLDEFTQINGMIPRLGAAREGLKGSVDKLKESLGNGDVKGAQAQLDRISTYNLDQLFKTDGINPNIFKELKVALTLRATSAQILKEVDRVLDKNGFKPSGPQNW